MLSVFFLALTMLAYDQFTRRPDLGRYLTVVAMMAASLASKATFVTLPLLLLLCDIWPCGCIAAAHIGRRPIFSTSEKLNGETVIHRFSVTVCGASRRRCRTSAGSELLCNPASKLKSGRHDSNVRPLRPERSALARLSYAPMGATNEIQEIRSSHVGET